MPPAPTAPSRRALLVLGGAVVAIGAGAGLGAEAVADPAVRLPFALDPTPTTGPVLQLAHDSAAQCIIRSPETGEFFVTQARAGTSGLIDAAGLAIGDVVVSRCSPAGALLDSMTLRDAGHGMSFAVIQGPGSTVLWICYAHPGDGGRAYDVVSLAWAPGVVTRSDCALVVEGPGYPLDVSYDRRFGTATMRHQGGGQPEYTRHRWADFLAGDLTRRTGAISTPDWPPTQQGFCSLGDAFFFYTGASSTLPDPDPPRLSQYSWATGRVVAGPFDTAGLARETDGGYPGGSFEPESATIWADPARPKEPARLLVGVVTGEGSPESPKVCRTFTYPLGVTS